jgi:C-terminal processing protease CtpA/Prc
LKTIFPNESQLPGEPTARYELVNRSNLGLQQPASPHFGGQVLILIDGQGFSTSAEFAAVAHASGRAIFIGEETSGSYYGNDSGITPTIVLPNTKLRIDVPLIAYYTAVTGTHDLDRGVLPDCDITYSIADELAGRDRALDTALEIASGQKLHNCVRKTY